MPNEFGMSVDLPLRPSLRALKWLFALHAAALVLMLFAMQPGRPMLILAAAFAGSWVWLRRHPAFGFGPRALTRLTWHAESTWTLHDAGGARVEAELLGNSYVHPALLVLNFSLKSGGRRTRALFGDEADEELLRRLRARLSTAEPTESR